jgi:hypothetical protein
MQGYRPIAVTEFAVRLLRAERESAPLPQSPEFADSMDVDHAADYARAFTSENGQKMVFAAQGKRLSLLHDNTKIPLQHAGGDSFLSTVEGVFADYAIVFGRGTDELNHKTRQANESAGSKDSVVKPPPVVEVSYGPDWYVSEAYQGPTTFAIAADYDAFLGRYRSDSAWGGDVRAYLLKGRLMLSGTALVRIGGGLFRAGDESWTPDTVEFLHVFEGRARLLRASGMDFWRVEVD